MIAVESRLSPESPAGICCVHDGGTVDAAMDEGRIQNAIHNALDDVFVTVIEFICVTPPELVYRVSTGSPSS